MNIIQLRAYMCLCQAFYVNFYVTSDIYVFVCVVVYTYTCVLVCATLLRRLTISVTFVLWCDNKQEYKSHKS